jgi:hypothetical protein
MKNFGVFVNAVRPATSKDGKEFIALDLVQIQPVMSKTSKKEYLGTVRASITTALSKEVAEALLGSEIGGKIIKTLRETPEEYTTKDGRKVTITYDTTWESAE